MGRIIKVWVASILLLSAGCAQKPGKIFYPETQQRPRQSNIAVFGYEACPVGFAPLMNAVHHAVVRHAKILRKNPEEARKLIRTLEINRLDAEGNAFLLLMIDDAITALCALPGVKTDALDNGRCPSRMKLDILCPLERYPLLPAEAWEQAFK